MTRTVAGVVTSFMRGGSGSTNRCVRTAAPSRRRPAARPCSVACQPPARAASSSFAAASASAAVAIHSRGALDPMRRARDALGPLLAQRVAQQAHVLVVRDDRTRRSGSCPRRDSPAPSSSAAAALASSGNVRSGSHCSSLALEILELDRLGQHVIHARRVAFVRSLAQCVRREREHHRALSARRSRLRGCAARARSRPSPASGNR